MRTLLSMLLCLLLSSLTSLSGNETFKQLTINNGLAHTDANCIVQDSTGLIWIGTYSGLQNYDGYSLQTYDYYPTGHTIFQSHNRIASIACTKEKLWIGTESGLTCFDLDPRRYVPYYIKDREEKYDFTTFIPKLFADPAGCHLWLKTTTEMIVVQISNDTIQPLKWSSEEERILSKSFNHLQFQKEIIWATTNRYIVKLGIHEGKISVLNTYESKELLQQNEKIQSSYLINNFLYIRTQKGCYRISVTGGELHKSAILYTDFHKIHPQIPLHTRGCFIVSKEGTLWCAYSEGIFEVRYPFSEKPFIQIYLRNSHGDKQSAQKVKNLQIDQYNNLWVATNSKGVFYRTLSKSLFRNISERDFKEIGLLKNEIMAVTGQKDGTIWMIAEYANLFCYNPQTEQLSFVPLPIKNNQAIYLQD